jgi:hypothetical protein
MSYVTTATVNVKSVTIHPNQAILDFYAGRMEIGISYKDGDGEVCQLFVAAYDLVSSESLEQAIVAAEQRCAELQISLLVEDTIAEHAKGHAIAQFFNELPMSGYDYDIYLALYKNECRDRDEIFKPSEEYGFDRADDLCRKIEAEYDSLMAFSATCQVLINEKVKKKWLITSDFDGGHYDVFIVTGSRKDAEDAALWRANEIAGVNGLNREDKSKWVFQDLDALCERLSMEDDEESSFWSDHDCALIYQLSIEEV